MNKVFFIAFEKPVTEGYECRLQYLAFSSTIIDRAAGSGCHDKLLKYKLSKFQLLKYKLLKYKLLKYKLSKFQLLKDKLLKGQTPKRQPPKRTNS